eukprot:5943527-Pyramimonas_sp.AAC.1
MRPNLPKRQWGRRDASGSPPWLQTLRGPTQHMAFEGAVYSIARRLAPHTRAPMLASRSPATGQP